MGETGGLVPPRSQKPAKIVRVKSRVTSPIGNSVRDFSKQKDLQGFLMDFSQKQKDFLVKVYEIFRE